MVPFCLVSFWTRFFVINQDQVKLKDREESREVVGMGMRPQWSAILYSPRNIRNHGNEADSPIGDVLYHAPLGPHGLGWFSSPLYPPLPSPSSSN